MGLITDRIFYTYDDVTIMPNEISDIEHRSECIPLDENGMLPLFTAPMDTVINEKNFELFNDEMINPILPRTECLSLRVEYSTKGRWAAYSLSEFESVFCNEKEKLNHFYKIKALIDVANGHMMKILSLAKAAKNIYGDEIILMAGNIANPNTYRKYAEVGIDYCRCSVGTGFCCLSSTQLGVHYPIASLIDDIIKVRESMKKEENERKQNRMTKRYKTFPKIVADGGVRNYSHIIKALALGADYVMCGSIFSKMLESAPSKYANSEEFLSLPQETKIQDLTNIQKKDGFWVGTYDDKEVFLGDITCVVYGMASKEGQIALNGCKTKTVEGKSKVINVEYTMHGWTSNFIDYLRSAMSYVGVKTINDFKKYSTLIVNSQNAISAINK